MEKILKFRGYTLYLVAIVLKYETLHQINVYLLGRTGITMPIIVITATTPALGDGTEALFKNIKEKTQSPVFAVVLGK